MEAYLKRIRDLGGMTASVIHPESVKTAPWVVYKCQFGCPVYGKKYCCPPYSPTWKQTQAMLSEYACAILFSATDMKQTSEIAVSMARQLLLDGYYKVIAFGSGNCKLCKSCNPEHCNFPEKAIPSMEACGIDVFATVRNNGMAIEVLKSKDETPQYFGLLLVE